ncbi:MAG: 3'-5' exoribonuclease YhaM [Melioribacteraceae bacterium]|nr:MAG: 3'-5' exoribonuclease YhaM [Melioribacteraceae bacterium]
MIDQKDLAEMAVGEKINHFLLVVKKEIKMARNNREFLNIDLQDRSSTLSAKMWDNFELTASKFAEGSIVKVTGEIDSYNDIKQIKINSIRPDDDNGAVTINDFLPSSLRDPDEMKTELRNRIKKIENSHLRALITEVFKQDQSGFYFTVPAGKSWHHAYVHGLLEHTLEIIRICDLMCDIHPEVNRDLIISGAILHDFGKTEELSASTGFDYTDKGQLLGHIVIVAMLIEKIVSSIDGFPDELKNNLIHLVLSHQGKLEYASPVVPRTLEAIILYHADELSAKTNAYKQAILSKENGDKTWTKYLPLAGTALYRAGFIDNEEENFKDTLF